MKYKSWEHFKANVDWKFFWINELLDLDMKIYSGLAHRVDSMVKGGPTNGAY